ncbi:unnamed protein product [Withania somnifera]
MASKISVSPFWNLPISTQKTQNFPQLPLLPHFPSSSRVVSWKLSSYSYRAIPVSAAVTEESQTSPPPSLSSSSSKVFLVVGGSGGVGQLVVVSLLNRNVKLCLVPLDPEKATTLFGEQDEEKLQVWKGDTRSPAGIDPSVFEGVTHVICCSGTTAFPSRQWDGDNTPERVDWDGVRNLVSALPKSLKLVVLVSSIGVTKFNEFPWSIMSLFGVLKYKKMGRILAGRLTDTSYDLNKLLQATAGERLLGDKLVGEISRLVVAEACIQALDIDFTEGQTYEINSIPVDGPGTDTLKRQELFRASHNN